MNLLDFAVLIGSDGRDRGLRRLAARAGARSLSHYLKGDRRRAGSPSASRSWPPRPAPITFLSTPGQGYQDGLGFVQNYFGAPLALIVIAAVFLPMYRRLNVYTAYEYLGRRFDAKTRLLGAALFLLQRGLAGRDHDLRAGDHPLDRAALAARRHDRARRTGGHRLHGGRRQRGRERDPEVPARRDLLRDGRGLRRPASEAAGDPLARRRPRRGGRLRASSTASTSRSTSTGAIPSGRACWGASSSRCPTSAPTSRRSSATSRARRSARAGSG